MSVLLSGQNQGPADLNTKAVQCLTQAESLRNEREWERERARQSVSKEEVYISAKSFSEQRQRKINKQYMCLTVSRGAGLKSEG